MHIAPVAGKPGACMTGYLLGVHASVGAVSDDFDGATTGMRGRPRLDSRSARTRLLVTYCQSAIRMPTSVALGSHFEEFVKAQLRSGRYNNVSEVVREGLRMLEDQEKWRQLKLETLRAEIQKGIDSGPGIPAEEVFSRLEAKYRQMAQERGEL